MEIDIKFPDRVVSYKQFVNDLAECLLSKMERNRILPEFINQATAYRIFGRANVERWRRKGKVEVYKRPGTVEYRTADLRELQSTVQDYLLNR